MNDTRNIITYPADNVIEDESLSVSLFDYLAIIVRYKILILTLILLGTAITVVWVMVMPQTYVATTILLPPDKAGGTNLTALMQGGIGLDFAALSENSSAEVFVKILKSRAVADSMIRRYDLYSYYDIEPRYRQLLLDIVVGNMSVEADRQGFISVSYGVATGFAPSPGEIEKARQLASAVANGAVDVLDALNRQKSVSSARRSRIWLEGVTYNQRDVVDSLQFVLQKFQEQNRAFAIDAQTQVSMESLIAIQTEINKKEIELAAAENDLRSGPVIETLRIQLGRLRQQKKRMEQGNVGDSKMSFTLGSVPELMRQYLSLKLDLEVATEIYQFLEAQYSQQQLQEARDLPSVSVLTAAEPPLLRAWPRRGLITSVAFIAIVFGAVLLAFAVHGITGQWQRLDPQRRDRLRSILSLRRSRTTPRLP